MAEVLKQLTERVFESGELQLTERQRDDLELPSHSTELELRHGGETVLAQWNGAARSLGGEALAEFLQMFGRVNGTLRLSRTGGQLDVVLLDQAPGLGGAFSSVLPARSGWSAGSQAPTPARDKPRRRPKAKKRPDKFRVRKRDEYTWHGQIGLLDASWQAIADRIDRASWASPEHVALRIEGERLAALDHFEELLSIDVAKVEPMPHQEAVVRKVLTGMRGRAVLADEVGLGKTIEAGLIVKELILRGLAKRVLILCPASLREQWKAEMTEKFGETFQVVSSGKEGVDHERLILSVTLARRHRDALARQRWDLVILDEAHKHLGGAATQALVHALSSRARYMLLLTATPVQNSLFELYQLVETVRPGTFTSKAQFKQAFMGDDDKTPRNPANLRSLVSSVIVRTTREQAGIDRVRRLPAAIPIDLSPQERRLYDLCLDAFHELNSSPQDRARARFLAHRVSASPMAVALMAQRMHERTQSAQAQRVLKEIYQLADSLPAGSRKTVALEQVRSWVRSHGSVLVFTQHTDTAKDLLKDIEESGLRVRAFHGGMSAEQRATSVRLFRRGQLQVLVSSDAGAEGLNLQESCHCVINYDLPWNPMRIEQRIGRVDRLGQPHPEVLIANLFTVNTIDEQVFRLLHHKLRMFELLFGQVTTILGELDDGNSELSFEDRVLQAMAKRTKQEQERAFAAFGDQLAAAELQAKASLGADKALSSWLANEATAHRRSIVPGAANELAAQPGGGERRRQAEVTSWVLQVLSAIGASVTHRECDDRGDEVFVSATVPDAYIDPLDGREHLHLAFSKHGLTMHPDAELCAAGSLVFDDLLDAVRLTSPIVVQQAELPPLSPEPPHLPAPGFECLSRTVRHDRGFGGSATIKAVPDDEDSGQAVISVSLTGDEGDASASVAMTTVADRSPLPANLGTTSAIARAVRSKLDRQLGQWLRSRAQDVAEQQRERIAERRRYWQEEIEKTNEAIRPLRRFDDRRWSLESLLEQQAAAMETELSNLQKPPQPEVRAELLTVALQSTSTFTVVEDWRDPRGDEWTVEYPWAGDEASTRLQSATESRLVENLMICSMGHAVDAQEAIHCASCDEIRCECCDVGTALQPCQLCGVPSCGRCNRATLGVCPRCSSVERLPELDAMGWVGWRTSSGVDLLVGSRSALIRPGSDEQVLAVQSNELADERYARMRHLAAARGLPFDAGFRIVLDQDKANPPSESSPVVHVHNGTRDEWRTVEGGGADVVDDPGEIEHAGDTPPVASETTLGFAKLLRKLRGDQAPAVPPMLERHVVSTRDIVTLHAEGLRQTMLERRPSQTWEAVSTTTAAWMIDEVDGVAVAMTTAGGVSATARLLNTSFLIDVHADDGRSWSLFAPSSEGRTLDGEECAHRIALEAGLETPVGYEAGTDLTAPAPPPNRAASLTSRMTRPAFAVRLAASDLAFAPEEAFVAARWMKEPMRSDTRSLPLEFGQHLADLFDTPGHRRPKTELLPRWVSDETWQGHGEASRIFTISPDTATLRPLDDTGQAESSFDVCSFGHLHQPAATWHCPACATWNCRACATEAALGPCPDCGENACGRCRAQPLADVGHAACSMCDRRSCSQCHRNLETRRCSVCERDGCLECTAGGTCVTCRGLEPASPAQLDNLPVDLRITTEKVFARVDRTAAVVAVVGDARRELLVAHRDGRIDWTSPPERSPADLLARRIAVAEGSSLDVVLSVHDTVGNFTIPEHAIAVVQDAARVAARWGARDANARFICEPATTDGAIAEVLRIVPVPQTEPEPADPSRWRAVTVLQDPPVAAPATVHLTLSFTREAVWVDAAGIERRWGAHDFERFDWAITEPVLRPLGRSLACAAGAGVDAELLRVNEVALVEVRADNATQIIGLGTSEALDQLDVHLAVERHLVAPATITARRIPVPAAATPTAAQLVDRAVDSVLVQTAGAEQTEPMTPAELSLLGLPAVTAPEVQVAMPRPQFPPSIEANFATRTVFERAWRVRERWSGHGEASLDYIVRAGENSAPRQGERALGDFGVCRDGHIHEPGETSQCDACMTWSCGVDGPEGAIDACLTCSQPSCGRCRHTSIVVDLVQCSVCDRKSCGSCNRRLHVEQCGLCGREVCSRCLQDGTCTTCHSFSAVRADDPRIPRLLRADALGVRIAEDGDATILLLNGLERHELAVVQAGELTTWLSAPWSAASGDEQQLAHQLASFLGVSEVQLQLDLVEDPLPDRASMLLEHATTRMVSWTAVQAGTVLRNGEPEDLPLSLSAVEALRSGLPRTRLPSVASEHRWPAVQASLPDALTHDVPIVTVTTTVYHDVAVVTPEGITSRARGTSALAGWSTSMLPDWVLPGLSTSSTPALIAQDAAGTAVLTVIGSLVLAALRWPDGRSGVWQLSGSAEELRLHELAHRMGLGEGVVRVASFVSAADVQLAAIANASVVSRHASYRATPVAPTAGEATWPAAQSLVPDVVSPTFAKLDPTVAASLEPALLPLLPPKVHHVAIDPLIVDVIRVGAQERRVDYVLASDRRRAYIVDEATGAPAMHLLVDRSGHLVSGGTPCPYCSQVSCARCLVQPQPCQLCGHSICEGCLDRLSVRSVQGLRLCPACQSLTAPHSGALRRALSGTGASGRDTLHQVHFTCSRDGTWFNGLGVTIHDPRLVAYLQQVLDRRQ